MKNGQLSHLDDHGKAQMVDISHKDPTDRIALAVGNIRLQPTTVKLIRDGLVKKGDVLTVAKIAGMMAAKNTSSLIPLCHPIRLEHIFIDLLVEDIPPGISIKASASAHDKTGVEMEALVAVAVTALTIYDMVKSVDKKAVIGDIHLKEKHGGKSGDFFVE